MKDLITSLLVLLVFTVLLGVAYPLAVWGVSQVIFPYQTNGSLIEANGKVLGSELIGQNFTSPGYFHGRPSSAGTGYDAGSSSGSNLGPTSKKLIDRIKADSTVLQDENPNTPIPADLVTTSASGLDPHISPAAARFQVPRIAKARGIQEVELNRLVSEHTEPRQLWLFGEPRVNVLKLNLDLDKTKPLNR